MTIKNFDGKVATVEFTVDEIAILNNALNEVRNGIDLDGEFDARMGCSVENARGLLAGIHNLGVVMAREISK